MTNALPVEENCTLTALMRLQYPGRSFFAFNLSVSVLSSQNHLLCSRAVDTVFVLSAYIPPGIVQDVFNEINFSYCMEQQEGEVL